MNENWIRINIEAVLWNINSMFSNQVLSYVSKKNKLAQDGDPYNNKIIINSLLLIS